MALADRFGLEGRVAIVTGGASGIGKGIVRVLGEAGATVVIADRDTAGAADVVAEFTGEGLRVEAVALDLIDETSIIACCADVVARQGAPWLLVNNAASQDRELFLDATAAEWDRTFAINARGPFLMAREIARAMADKGEGGRIVNIASNSVRAPQVLGLGAYAASKGALTTFSQTIAFELLPHRITVNTVLPGGVITPGAINAKGPKGEGPASSRRPPFGFCEPEDIGGAVLYLASPAARYVTNQAIMVDAGFSLT
jgi:NAD(P)-dependent dehydrogenase (short-subunit alcohol dehydrogenase family)